MSPTPKPAPQRPQRKVASRIFPKHAPLKFPKGSLHWGGEANGTFGHPPSAKVLAQLEKIKALDARKAQLKALQTPKGKVSGK